MGYRFTEEHRKHSSDAHRGFRHSEVSKQKIAESRLGERHPLYGKHHSEEAKCKMSIAAYHRMIDPAKQTYYNTSIERALQLALSKLGVKFGTHKNVYGNPDIFVEPNICIFCDGTYWHADPRKYASGIKVHHNQTAQKIWDRDEKITDVLKSQGYEVLRFWEKEINGDASICAQRIHEHARRVSK